MKKEMLQKWAKRLLNQHENNFIVIKYANTSDKIINIQRRN